MDDIQDFESYYTTRVIPIISDLKLQKQKADNWRIALVTIILLTLGSFIMDQIPLGCILIIPLIISTYYYTRKNDVFIDRFKETIIHDIINFVHPGLIYKPESIVSSKEYRSSGHYRYIYDYYEGDDYIEGSYKNVNFHCCELETHIATRGKGYRGSNKYVDGSSIFKGLFFVAVINQFRGGTYIWTKGEEQLPESIMDEYYRLITLPDVQKARVVNEEFSKYFSVYTTYPAEAMVLLDEEMIQRMLDFRKQVNRKVQFSFVAGKFYVSIPINENMLEPTGDLDDKELIKEYFFSILLILSIINQLRLNRFA